MPQLKFGHSPDLDFPFMLWALAHGKVSVPDVEIETVPADIETLNRWAVESRLELSAVSLAAYPTIEHNYSLLDAGASVATHGAGPVIVARRAVTPARLREVEIAVPGRHTTAFVLTRMYLGGPFEYRELRFDLIAEAVAGGEIEAGVVIDGTQLTHEAMGLHPVVRLGAWWFDETRLPLPLAVTVGRRDVDPEILAACSVAIEASLRSAQRHPEEALSYALSFNPGVTPDVAARFVELYIGDQSVGLRSQASDAIREFFRRARLIGAVEEAADSPPDFARRQ